ncbi:GNAT family N-acetyltransferase [Pseudovibrio exalbescens]|uniref:N-acetyltransferase domain-containing protein n=1 Tax=Pseudovibrio exalbescens TaxID=197461 RepID=A0A1U7JL48_9HYPH|nr:GNAT family N-acetyltransferase [Pseudovibrio exalbescens]OKL45371.1 hypothetical protein A3843_03325 [Pseudovibrio exalbescens]
MSIAKPCSGEVVAFEELGIRDLHDLLRLRCEVFVVEQACAYPDVDGEDPVALHLLHRDGSGKLAGYLRIFTPKGGGSHWKIGRVVVDPAFRKAGVARGLMSQAIEYCRAQDPGCRIDLQAQVYLRSFYESLGFTAVSNEYLEDGIPHIDMVNDNLL